MKISPLPASSSVEGIPLEKLAQNQTLTEDQKIGELSQQFESMLLRQILGQARQTVFKSKFSNDSVTSTIYRDMVTTQLAEGISRSGDFGLARSLELQLGKQLEKKP